MVGWDQHVVESEEIVAKGKKFLQEECGCSHGVKGGQCWQQFLEEVVLCNRNNCLELSHGELNFVILANIQAFTKLKSSPKKGKEVHDALEQENKLGRRMKLSQKFINMPLVQHHVKFDITDLRLTGRGEGLSLLKIMRSNLTNVKEDFETSS